LPGGGLALSGGCGQARSRKERGALRKGDTDHVGRAELDLQSAAVHVHGRRSVGVAAARAAHSTAVDTAAPHPSTAAPASRSGQATCATCSTAGADSAEADRATSTSRGASSASGPRTRGSGPPCRRTCAGSRCATRGVPPTAGATSHDRERQDGQGSSRLAAECRQVWSSSKEVA